MVHFNRNVSRVLALALSVVMVITLMLAPAGAEAAKGVSAEGKFSLEKMDASVKLFVSPDAPVLAVIGALGVEGNTLLDAALYLTADSLILESKALLEQAVGIDLTTALDNLPKSVFAPDSGSMYALEELDYIALQGFFAGREAGAAQVTAPAAPSFTLDQLDMMEEVGAKYADLIPSLFMDNASMAMSPETVEVGSQKLATSRVTLSLSNEALTNIVTAFLTTVAEDADLKQVSEWILEVGLANMPEKAAAQLEGMTAADIIAELWAALPEMAQEAAASIQASGMGCAVSVNTGKATGSIIRLSAELSAGEDTLSVVYTMGESFAESEEISLKLLLNGEEEAAIVYQQSTETEEKYAASITVAEAGEVVAVMLLEADYADNCYTVTQAAADGMYNVFRAQFAAAEDGALKAEFTADLETVDGKESYAIIFSWDDAQQRYTLSLTDNGDTSSLSGAVSSQDDDVVITVDQANGVPMNGMALVLHGSDSVEVPAFNELLTMSEDEVSILLSTFVEIIGGMV